MPQNSKAAAFVYTKRDSRAAAMDTIQTQLGAFETSKIFRFSDALPRVTDVPAQEYDYLAFIGGARRCK